MPQIKSAKKRMRQSEARRIRNKAVRSRTATQVKKVRLAIERGDADGARRELSASYRSLDKAAKTGVIHRKTAARKRSRLARSVNRVKTAPGV